MDFLKNGSTLKEKVKLLLRSPLKTAKSQFIQLFLESTCTLPQLTILLTFKYSNEKIFPLHVGDLKLAESPAAIRADLQPAC